MKGFSAHLPWVAGLAGLLLVGTAGCAIDEDALCASVSCDDGNECTADVCDPSNGTCANTALDDGTECNADLGMCVGGECCGSPPEIFADGDFADGAWTSTEVEGRSEGIRSFEVSTVSPGGNDGAYHRVEATLDGTDGQAGIWVAHAFNVASYDGDICGLRVFLDGTDQFDQASRSSFFSVFLFQNETYYRGEEPLQVSSGMWVTEIWTEVDFRKFDGVGPTDPELTNSDATIQFGYLTGSSRPAGLDATTTVAGADNFRVEIYPPEP